MMSDSDDEGLLFPSLPMGKLRDKVDLSVPPSSAEEYLQQVVWEARLCKEIVTVEVDHGKLKKQGALVQKHVKTAAPHGFIPSMDAQHEILREFSKLRSDINDIRINKRIPPCPVALPERRRQDNWCCFCFGKSFLASLNDNQLGGDLETSAMEEGHQPLLSVVLNINQVTLSTLIDWQSQWLDDLGFSEAQGKWIYALLVCLEKPLDPDLCSDLRRIVRTCATIRAAITSNEDCNLPQLNTIICIIARYFNQDDLAD